jgi:hypothetical protein
MGFDPYEDYHGFASARKNFEGHRWILFVMF